MSTVGKLPGFHQISRDDGLFQERMHDTYKARHKLPEPTVCTSVRSDIPREGRLRQWGKATADAQRETCLACHRTHDHFPAGFLTLQGAYFLAQVRSARSPHEIFNHIGGHHACRWNL